MEVELKMDNGLSEHELQEVRKRWIDFWRLRGIGVRRLERLVHEPRSRWTVETMKKLSTASHVWMRGVGPTESLGKVFGGRGYKQVENTRLSGETTAERTKT